MSQEALLGILIPTLVVLIGFLTAIITPIIKLNTTLTKLDQTIKNMNSDMSVQKDRITEHGKEIDRLHEEAIRHGIIIENHESRLTTLEGLHKRKGEQ